MAQMLTIDRLDASILGLLGSPTRPGVVEMASALGVTRSTVQSRIRRLEESGMLGGFRPELDLAALGIDVEAFIALALEQGMLGQVVERLVAIPNVLEIHATTGREDLLARVATTSHADLQDLIQQILAIDGVSHSNSTLALTSPLPYRVQPLLDHVTREAGWGRSTPLPDDTATAGARAGGRATR
jgi:DNA-binding Lrp family transcriptional regulator